MTANDKDIVAALQAALTEQVGEERFALWFGSKSSLAVEHDKVIVVAADQFTLDRLKKSFRREIGTACEAVFGEVPPVEFRVDGSLAAPNSTADAGHDREIPDAESSDNPPVSIPIAGRPPRRKLASLDAYVVGDSNRVAHTIATATPGRLGAVSPLFLYGPTGCGKTHLLQGIYGAVRRMNSRRRAVLLAAEQFTSYFLEALHGSGLPNFRRKYRDADLLLVDDVQFFGGKRATLVELQHTIDTLIREGKQLVLAADRPPAELHGLGPELAARMSGGLVCGIDRADLTTRLGIVTQLARQRQIRVPAAVLELVAARLDGDARELSGALNRLQAMSEALEQSITLDFAETALADLFRATRRTICISDIERVVCDICGLEPKTLQSSRKGKDVSHPRMLAMWLARQHTRAAYGEIGHYFGRRTHSTVISAQKKVACWMRDGARIPVAHGNCQVADVVRRVEAELRTG